MISPTGSFHLLRFRGIDVQLHWSWFLIAAFQLTSRSAQGMFEGPYWHVAVYLSLFGIVLLHEFGHALACRSVGGVANRIVLWPLGGVAYVRPPMRPGAVLWSIAAGPLVNVALVPVTIGLFIASGAHEVPALRGSDLQTFVTLLAIMNFTLLAFNLLPVYPLDGGQIVHALLWFVMGWRKSLLVTAGLGALAAAVGVGLAMWMGDYWLVIVALYLGFNAVQGWRMARSVTGGPS